MLDFIYPTRCAACDKILEESEIKCGFCKRCRAILSLTKEDVCLKCGKPLKDKSRELCDTCEGGERKFTQAKGVYCYLGPMKSAMYRFKYENRRLSSRTFAREAVNLHGDWLRLVKPKAIIPVPMYRQKERVRGYNQAEVFARDLSKLTGIPVFTDVILRTRDTKALKTLSPTERKLNLKNSFKNTKKFRKKADILIVDDIYTTGATVEEVAYVLKNAGAGNIYCLFVCTGVADK